MFRNAIFFLGILLLGEVSIACQDRHKQTLQALDKTQANNQLSNALLGSGDAANDIRQSVRDSKCYLDRVYSLHPELANIASSLEALGQTAINAETPEQKRTIISAINSQVARDSGSGFVQFPSKKNSNIELNLFSSFIDTNCGEQATIDCAQNTELAIKLWQIAGEFRSFADTLNKSDQANSSVYLDKLDAQWRSYKDDTIKLWPQEVLLNSLFYSPAKKGISAPPAYKLLGLRPSLGLSYLSDQSHRIQPTVNVDLLGLYWWKYGADNTAQTGRGISASLVWDGDDTAYGLSYHHNPKWSITVAKGDENDVVISLSFQLAHWLLRK